MLLHPAGRLADGIEDTRVRAAAADIALQRLNDLLIAGFGVCLQEADTAHDHSRSAVGALEGVEIQEGLLHGVKLTVFFEAFDGGDRLHYFAEQNLAGTPRRPADQDRARAALPFTAAVFCAGEAEFVAQNGEKTDIRVGVDWVFLAVNFKF